MVSRLWLTAGPWFRRVAGALEKTVHDRLFAYVSIVLVQAKISWGLWLWRDLTSGDTSSYFVKAYDWYTSGQGLITWSPLYTTFIAIFFAFTSDAFWIVTAHRLIIVLAVSVLVLAVLRRLLPPVVAWFMAAWWALLPIDFDPLYEVHLFGLIPVLITVLVIGDGKFPWRRGAAIATLLLGSLLVRNELLIAAVFMGCVVLVHEISEARRCSGRPASARSRLVGYGLPLALVAVVTAVFLSRAKDRGILAAMFARKHTLNVCQVLAFGYQQRHADFQKSPWLECQELMTRLYGKPEPSFIEAGLRNPRAVSEHLAWNVRLFPAGVQVLLFNVTSDSHNPDYAAVCRSWLAIPLSIMWLSLIAAGGVSLWPDARRWWRAWIQPRGWPWLVLLSATLVAVILGLTQRPRPSYLFSLGIFLRALTGIMIVAVLGRIKLVPRFRWLFPLAVLMIIVLVPSYYPSAYRMRPQLLLEAYRRLAPFEEVLGRRGTTFVAANFWSELCNYVGKGRCIGLSYSELRDQVRGGRAWVDVVRMRGVNVVYADRLILGDPEGRAFVSELLNSGWRTVAFADWVGGRWMLLEKVGSSE